MNKNLMHVTLPKNAEIRTIVETIDKHGIAILPEFFSGDLLTLLNAEFDEFLSNAKSTNNPSLVNRDELVALPVVRNQIDEEKFPTTAKTFASQMMRDISVSYLGTEKIGLNHQIYVNLNNATTSPVDKLPFLPHFDKISTFKFFVYLTDTTLENGAMGVLPGSHIKNRKSRKNAHAEFGNTKQILNVMNNDNLQPVEGKAGTLFIFDTDVTHGAGFVQKGNIRRIMRGHTRTTDHLQELGLAHQAE